MSERVEYIIVMPRGRPRKYDSHKERYETHMNQIKKWQSKHKDKSREYRIRYKEKHKSKEVKSNE